MEKILVFSFKFFKCQQKLLKNAFTSPNDGTILGYLLLMTPETAHKGHQEGN
uniref:Uncharacterized protein n=1 Tax=Meloidogyne enterolobii TaxID=390850 RepID=A0A6V7V5H6_MELEN|nr:unnamed protein product [Meloidogyne enterolobii]